MCLSAITETGLNKSGSGWKVFDIGECGKPKFECYRLRGDLRVPVRRWVKAGGPRELTSRCGVKYRGGFHIFISRKDAGRWCMFKDEKIIKVNYRGGHTTGKQGNLLVIVAKEMYVPND